MFRTREFIFRKTVVYRGTFDRTHSSTYQTVYTVACKTHNAITLYTTVFLNYEPSGTKHVEDIKKLKIKMLI